MFKLGLRSIHSEGSLGTYFGIPLVKQVLGRVFAWLGQIRHNVVIQFIHILLGDRLEQEIVGLPAFRSLSFQLCTRIIRVWAFSHLY